MDALKTVRRVVEIVAAVIFVISGLISAFFAVSRQSENQIVWAIALLICVQGLVTVSILDILLGREEAQGQG